MPTVMDERIAERRAEVRAERRNGRRRRTLTVVVILIVGITAAVVERSALVALDSIQVSGTIREDPDAVREAADLPLGTSTLRLRLGAVEERVERLPSILHAEARRVDPLTVAIEVVERQPMLVAASPSREVLVDPEGVVIAVGAEPGLPRVTVPSVPDPGQPVAVSPPLRTAHSVYLALPAAVRQRVAGMHAPAARDLRLDLRDGPTVRFGDANRIQEKVRSLRAVLADVGDVPISMVDVRPPGRPVVRR